VTGGSRPTSPSSADPALAAPRECLELPRPVRLVRTAGWNLAESFGLPTGCYILAAWLGGRDAGLWAMLAAIWFTAGMRKLVTRSVPGLVAISLMVLTLQTLAAIATGNLLIFLLHFPLANLGLCVLFARTARGHSPIAERLAAEVIGLRCPAVHCPHRGGDRGVDRVAQVRDPQARHRIPVHGRPGPGLIGLSRWAGVTTGPFGIFI
jgi:hypothetical protein